MSLSERKAAVERSGRAQQYGVNRGPGGRQERTTREVASGPLSENCAGQIDSLAGGMVAQRSKLVSRRGQFQSVETRM